MELARFRCRSRKGGMGGEEEANFRDYLQCLDYLFSGPI